MVSVDDHGGILEKGTRVHQVVFNPRRSGDPDAPVNARRDRNPTAMTNRRDRFSGRVEFLNESQDVGITPQFIRHEPAWDEQRVEIGLFHVRDRGVTDTGITELAVVVFARRGARDDDVRAGFDQTEFGVPKLEILVNLADKGEHALARECCWRNKFRIWKGGHRATFVGTVKLIENKHARCGLFILQTPHLTKTAVDALARPKDDLFDNSTMTFGEHLEELRGALVKAIIWLMIGLGFGLLVANRVVRYIQAPLKEAIVEYNAQRDMALMGLSDQEKFPDEDKLLALQDFMRQGGLVAELVYTLPAAKMPLAELAAAKIAAVDETATGDDPTASAADPGLDANDSTRRVSTAELIDALGEVPDPSSMVPTIQFRRSERGVSSLKVEETFMIWVKAGLIVGAVLASPMIFYHLWSFVAAGLHSHERRYVYVYLPFSVILFVAGVTLAFFLVLHYVLNFLLAFNSSMDVAVEPRLSYYVNFVLMLPLGFGIAFQLPLVMLFLQRIGLIETDNYISSWRVAVLVIFIISMVATPADVTSMVALAIPLLILYFLGIGMCLYMPRGRGLGHGAYDPA